MKLRQILNEIIEGKNLSSIYDDPKYNEFFSWLTRFQNQKTAWVPPEFKKFKDEFDLVDPSKTYKCYRGLFFRSPTKAVKKIINSRIISDAGTSWSLNYDTAFQFARDDHHGFGGTARWNPGKSLGVIIEYTFNSDEILCDFEFMEKQGFDEIRYPKEKEVVVFEKERTCKIVEIIQKQTKYAKEVSPLN